MKELSDILHGIPCHLLIRQLLLFAVKYETTLTPENVALWDTLGIMRDAVLVSYKQKGNEDWERCLFALQLLMTTSNKMYLEKNMELDLLVEIMKIIMELYKMIFDGVCSELGLKYDVNTVGLNDDVTNSEVSNDVMKDDVASSSHDDVIFNARDNVLHKDVIVAIDESIKVRVDNVDDKCGRGNATQMLEKFIKIVFECKVFKEMFYYYVDSGDTKIAGISKVSELVTDCVCELLKYFHHELLQERYRGLMEPFFVRLLERLIEENFHGDCRGR